MKKFFCLIFFLLLAKLILAQQIDLTLYQNSDFFNVTKYNASTASYGTNPQTTFNRISVAVALHLKSKRFHELELFVPKIKESSSAVGLPMNYEIRDGNPAFDRKTNSFSFRYEFAKEFAQKRNWRFAAGVAVNPFYLKIDYISSIPIMYNRHWWKYGASINLVPRVTLHITDRFQLSLSLPFKVYDFSYEQQRIDNPSIPVRQQTSGGWVNGFFQNAYNLRLGFIYRFE